MRHILPNSLAPVLIFVKTEPEANIFLLEQILKLSLAICSDELQNWIWSNDFKSMFVDSKLIEITITMELMGRCTGFWAQHFLATFFRYNHLASSSFPLSISSSWYCLGEQLSSFIMILQFLANIIWHRCKWSIDVKLLEKWPTQNDFSIIFRLTHEKV